MEKMGLSPAEGSYRLRLLEEIYREACARGLYRIAVPPEKPDPKSDFRIVMDDMLFLLDHLPASRPGDSLTRLRRRIKAALSDCRSDLIRAIPESDVYYLMRFARQRSNGRYKPTADELKV